MLAGKPDLAIPLHERSLELQKAKLGPEHLDTLTSIGVQLAVLPDSLSKGRVLFLVEIQDERPHERGWFLGDPCKQGAVS